MTTLCSDCPPEGYPTHQTRCNSCPRRTRLYFITDFHDDEACLYEPRYLTDEGLPKDQWNGIKALWVDRNRVHADQDGVFVREEKIDGEIHYRQCPPPETAI